MSLIAICLGLESYRPAKGKKRKIQYVEAGKRSKTYSVKMRDTIVSKFSGADEFLASDVTKQFSGLTHYAAKHHLNLMCKQGVLEKTFRLSEIENTGELSYYGNGYFNIRKQ